MPLAMSGENIKLTCPLCHEVWKMVLSDLFSYSLPYIEKILSTSECSCGYGPYIEMGIVSYYVSTHPQLGPVKISGSN